MTEFTQDELDTTHDVLWEIKGTFPTESEDQEEVEALDTVMWIIEEYMAERSLRRIINESPTDIDLTIHKDENGDCTLLVPIGHDAESDPIVYEIVGL